MESVKNWIFSVCVAAIVITALNMLIPKGKSEKIMQFVIGLFFVLLISAPIAAFANGAYKINPNAAIDGYTVASNSESYEDKLKKILIKKVNSNLEAGLKSQNINFKYLSSDINITADNCIQIIEVKIYQDGSLSNSDCQKIRKYVKKQTGIYPEILT